MQLCLDEFVKVFERKRRMCRNDEREQMIILEKFRNILKMFLNILKVPERILEMPCGKKFCGTF